MVRRPIIENCFCGSKDYDGLDKRNAAQLPYSGWAGGTSEVARRPDVNGQDFNNYVDERDLTAWAGLEKPAVEQAFAFLLSATGSAHIQSLRVLPPAQR